MKTLKKRMQGVLELSEEVKRLDTIAQAKSKAWEELRVAEKQLVRAKARYMGARDDLVGDLLNGCFEEAPLSESDFSTQEDYE